MKNIKPICIIPARMGSQRLKNKNILKVKNCPLIGHVIKMALRSKIFSKIVVSTDSRKIAKISKKYGADVPFIRSKKLSGGNVTIRDTLVDCITRLGSEKNKFHFCIYPTAILLEPNDLLKGYKKIIKYKGNSLLAVVDNGNIYRSFIFNKKKNELKFKWLKFSKWMSQDLPRSYIDTGTFYIFNTEKLLKSSSIHPKKIIPYFIEKTKGIDLNDKDDLKLIEALKSK